MALTLDGQAGCGVVPLDDANFVPKDGVERFTIAPVSEEYIENAEEKRGMFPDFEPCGAYGVTNGVQYFEYHEGRRSRLLFMRIGQVVTIFDVESLVVEL